MSPNERKHWCKHCKKSFPSGRSLGGHMAMHRSKHKKQTGSTRSLPSADDGTCRYGLRDRRHRTWLLCDSSDDQEIEDLTLVPKTECQLCFKVFASCDALALSMHMKAHARHQQKESREDATMSIGCECDDVAVSAPVALTYGVQEVGAARILLMLSAHSDTRSAAVDYCNEDYQCQRDSNSGYQVQESKVGLDCSSHGQFGDDKPTKPENCSSDGRMKFSSLSGVLKATAVHKCKLCSKVFASGKALGGHMKASQGSCTWKSSSIPQLCS